MSAAPRIGIAYSGSGSRDEVIGFARRVEEAGFDSLWVNENVHSRVPHHDPLVALAVMAAHTSQVTVGTAVVLLPLRNPVELARTAASLDVLSEGRLVLGVSVGGGAPEGYEAYGVPLEERGPRTDEALEVMTRLWTGEPTTWHGRFTSFTDYALGTRPIQKPRIPLWVGGVSEPVLRRAARWGDGFLPIRRSAQECAELYRRVAAYADAQGRDPSAITMAIYIYVCLADSAQVAQQIARGVLEERYRYAVEFLKPGENAALGPPDACAELVEAFAAAGAREIILDLACPPEERAAQLETLAAGLP